jgi:hypothetical protein
MNKASRACLTTAVLALTSACGGMMQTSSTDVLSQVDHLVYATTDLDRGIAEIERLTGVRASAGGQHPGRGTHNALLSLGPNVYLEIIARDTTQPQPTTPRAFGLDTLTTPRLVTWSAKGTQLDQLHRTAAASNIALGAVSAGSRRRPDGVLLSWQFTDPAVAIADGIIPFFIDWGSSPHPAHSAVRGATLVAFRAEHPDAQRVQQTLQQLRLKLTVSEGRRPALIATIEGPRGRIELR